jgi:hypothetical protein
MKRSKAQNRQERGMQSDGGFNSVSGTERESARDRVLKALSAMRRGVTLSRATRENGVTPRTVKRYAAGALLQERPGGRIRARKSDRLVRYLQIPGPDGPIEITAKGLKQAREFAKYKAAVNRLLRGDRNALAEWHGKKVAGTQLVTNTDILVALARNELLPYSLYRSISGGAV